MLEWLLYRETVITLAVLGAAATTLSSILKVKGLPETRMKQLNQLGYVFMAISMILFIIVGFRGPAV